jgi:hypothetical protein
MTAARCPAVACPAVVLPAARFRRASARWALRNAAPGSPEGWEQPVSLSSPVGVTLRERRLRLLSRPDANSGPPARVSGVARRSASDAVLWPLRRSWLQRVGSKSCSLFSRGRACAVCRDSAGCADVSTGASASRGWRREQPTAVRPTRCWPAVPSDWPGGEDDRELLPGFAVAGVEDHMPGAGVDPDQPGDLTADAGFFESPAPPCL